MAGALSNIKVLDLTRLLPGPYCTMVLADLGAEVLKIEEPKGGDYLRWLPPLIDDTNAGFTYLNRNKGSMTLNLKTRKGVEILKRLVGEYDVLLEGFRPGVMDSLGVGYQVLKKENKDLIYCSLTGYGQSGPYVKKAGHDIDYLAVSGVASISGIRNGAPVLPGVQMADLGGALTACVAILAAVIHRRAGGGGQWLDISMTDSVLALLSVHAAEYFYTGKVPKRGEMTLNGKYICYRFYECKDGKYLAVGALEPKFWENFCKSIQEPDFIPEQFSEGERRDKLAKKLENIFLAKTRDEWLQIFKDKDVCVEPVNNFAEALEHPQVVHREMVVEVEHPRAGKIKQPGIPFKFSNTPGEVKWPARPFGNDTEKVLKNLGYTSEQIGLMKEEGVI